MTENFNSAIKILSKQASKDNLAVFSGSKIKYVSKVALRLCKVESKDIMPFLCA